MSSRFHQISQKDSGACQCMTAVQMHSSHIGAWELDDLEDWIKKMEILRQDLIHSGHTEAIADDCIISNLLHTLIEVPSGSAHSEHWKFAARTWKADHSKNHYATWLILKTSMLDEIKELRAYEVKHSAARPSKRAKEHVPTGMALVATELNTAVAGLTALSAQLQERAASAPPIRTRAGKAREECNKSRENTRENQF
eukprot:2938824-Rhodomonas_salina.1